MKKLDKEFQSKQNTYKQLEEGDNHYIYAVWNLKDKAVGEPSYYEIFKKKVAKAATLKGVYYPERETYPNDKDFGDWAWCCNTLEKCNYIKNEKSLF